MLLPAEYDLLILAERREAERISTLLRRVSWEEANGLHGYSAVDLELRHARRRLEAVSSLLEHSAGKTSADVRRALYADLAA